MKSSRRQSSRRRPARSHALLALVALSASVLAACGAGSGTQDTAEQLRALERDDTEQAVISAMSAAEQNCYFDTLAADKPLAESLLTAGDADATPEQIRGMLNAMTDCAPEVLASEFLGSDPSLATFQDMATSEVTCFLKALVNDEEMLAAFSSDSELNDTQSYRALGLLERCAPDFVVQMIAEGAGIAPDRIACLLAELGGVEAFLRAADEDPAGERTAALLDAIDTCGIDPEAVSS